jgi:hypothetical protein
MTKFSLGVVASLFMFAGCAQEPDVIMGLGSTDQGVEYVIHDHEHSLDSCTCWLEAEAPADEPVVVDQPSAASELEFEDGSGGKLTDLEPTDAGIRREVDLTCKGPDGSSKTIHVIMQNATTENGCDSLSDRTANFICSHYFGETSSTSCSPR